MIASICCYFNWNNNKVRKDNYIQFRKNFKHPLITVEICLDKENFFIDDSIKILANKNNILWQKERAFNIAIEGLSDKYDKVLWVDTDILFLNENVMTELEDKLDQYDMVQPFDRVYEYEYSERSLNQKTHTSTNRCLNTYGYAKTLLEYTKTNKIISSHPAFGLAWGINLSIMPNNCFYDKHILGSNDLLQIQSVTLDVLNKHFIGKYNNELVRSWINYCKKMPQKTKYDIGYCSGDLEHLYHGETTDRGYSTREKILHKHNFNPETDIRISRNGLYEILNKEMQSDILKYFENRNISTYHKQTI